MKKISILGSTGSIGTSALKVVDSIPEKFRVVGISANRNIDLLIVQCKKYRPEIVAVAEKDKYLILKEAVSPATKVVCGLEGLIEVAAHMENDLLVSAIVGVAGLIPTYEAIKKGIDIAIANKEALVVAGSIITSLAKEKNVKLLPVDSEHNALFQCLTGQKKEWVKKLILTASGGPFLNVSRETMSRATVEQALAHPKWSMGKKISIDSATMMNKGLEVIEAHWLFDVPFDSIDVLIHPESIIHSMVEFVDGSYLAQMNVPDMCIPIQNALTYPERIGAGIYKSLDFCAMAKLSFLKPDFDKFPSLKLSYEAGKIGHTMPAVLNASNEEAVKLFLNGEINFDDIPRIIADVMDRHDTIKNPNLETLFEIDKWARTKSKEILKKISGV